MLPALVEVYGDGDDDDRAAGTGDDADDVADDVVADVGDLLIVLDQPHRGLCTVLLFGRHGDDGGDVAGGDGHADAVRDDAREHDEEKQHDGDRDVARRRGDLRQIADERGKKKSDDRDLDRPIIVFFLMFFLGFFARLRRRVLGGDGGRGVVRRIPCAVRRR